MWVFYFQQISNFFLSALQVARSFFQTPATVTFDSRASNRLEEAETTTLDLHWMISHWISAICFFFVGWHGVKKKGGARPAPSTMCLKKMPKFQSPHPTKPSPSISTSHQTPRGSFGSKRSWNTRSQWTVGLVEGFGWNPFLSQAVAGFCK